jgi:hypothetical protein
MAGKDVMVVAKGTTRTDSIKRSGKNGDGFAKEISRIGIDNGRSRIGHRVRSDDNPFRAIVTTWKIATRCNCSSCDGTVACFNT